MSDNVRLYTNAICQLAITDWCRLVVSYGTVPGTYVLYHDDVLVYRVPVQALNDWNRHFWIVTRIKNTVIMFPFMKTPDFSLLVFLMVRTAYSTKHLAFVRRTPYVRRTRVISFPFYYDASAYKFLCLFLVLYNLYASRRQIRGYFCTLLANKPSHTNLFGV